MLKHQNNVTCTVVIRKFSMRGESLWGTTARVHWGSGSEASRRRPGGLGAKPPELGDFCNFSI